MSSLKNKKKIPGKKSFPPEPSHVDNLVPVKLPRPSGLSGKSISYALKNRKTIREISDRKLPLQTLSDLLWAAWGINRKKGPFDIPGRTAASASNSQEIDLYVVREEGTYIYNADHHRLDPVYSGDLRAFTIGKGQTDFAAHLPLHLLYVADIDKLIHTSGYREPGLMDPEIQKSYFYVDTGLIAANVYLFASSRKLAAWFHNCNKGTLNSKLKLRKNQKVLFGQSVGYPAK